MPAYNVTMRMSYEDFPSTEAYLEYNTDEHKLYRTETSGSKTEITDGNLYHGDNGDWKGYYSIDDDGTLNFNEYTLVKCNAPYALVFSGSSAPKVNVDQNDYKCFQAESANYKQMSTIYNATGQPLTITGSTFGESSFVLRAYNDYRGADSTTVCLSNGFGSASAPDITINNINEFSMDPQSRNNVEDNNFTGCIYNPQGNVISNKSNLSLSNGGN